MMTRTMNHTVAPCIRKSPKLANIYFPPFDEYSTELEKDDVGKIIKTKIKHLPTISAQLTSRINTKSKKVKGDKTR